MKLNISVIIPVYNDYEGLKITLECLQKQTIDKSQIEIIIANDGADIEIKRTGNNYGAKVINITPNQGAYKARNLAIMASSSSNLAFTDSDIVIKSDWLENGLKALEKADYVVGPVGIISKPNMKIYEKYEYYTAFNMKRYFDLFGFGGAGNLFVKKSVFEKVGFFDDRLRSGGDGEFGRRVHLNRNISQKFCEDILVFHPLRKLNDMINKTKRVSKGLVQINDLHPENLHPKMKPNIIKALFYAIVPPIPMDLSYKKDKDVFLIYLFNWFYRSLSGIYTFKWIIMNKIGKLS